MSPGIFALVGAGAFLAGVSRMTISLAVIMFELTGNIEYIVPCSLSILVAKFLADALEKEGVYDLAQTVLGHPFLDLEVSLSLVRTKSWLVEELIPPQETMREIKVEISADGTIGRRTLEEKLRLLLRRGLMDAGLVLIRKDTGMLLGYLAQGELEFGLGELSQGLKPDCKVQLISNLHYSTTGFSRAIPEDAEPASPDEADSESLAGSVDRIPKAKGAYSHDDILDLTAFVDRTPLSIPETAPMEYAVEMFGKLGLRYLMVTEEVTGRLVGVIIKKRLVDFLDRLRHEH